MRARRNSLLLAVGLLAALGEAGEALANERRFTFTYESATLPQGERELEVWMTPRIGRKEYFTRFDQRLEFETGLTDRLMMALYLNQSATTERGADGALATESEFEGFSAEGKYKLMDPVADPFGFALYGEVRGSTNELETEAKLIFDKKIDRLLFAANLVGEYEWKWERVGAGPTAETGLELDLAGAYFITDHLSLGVEVRNVNEITPDEGWEHSALFAGPTLAYATRTWWIAVSALPQLPAIKHPEAPDEQTGLLILDSQERFNGRVLFSFLF